MGDCSVAPSRTLAKKSNSVLVQPLACIQSGQLSLPHIQVPGPVSRSVLPPMFTMTARGPIASRHQMTAGHTQFCFPAMEILGTNSLPLVLQRLAFVLLVRQQVVSSPQQLVVCTRQCPPWTQT